MNNENSSCERVEELKYLGTTRLRVFENRVLRRIFGPTRDEVPGLWRKLHNEELNSCTNIIRPIQSRKTRKAGHVARMGRGKLYTGLWWGNLSERDHLQYTGIWGIVLKMVLSKWDGGMDWINIAQNRNR
jgi:hypothetical protein